MRANVQGGKKEPVRPKLGNKVATIANLPPINRPTENIIFPFTTSEKSFDNEHDVINWIIDNQLSRRNITDDQRAYLIGKRYKEEKKEHGNTRESINKQVKRHTDVSLDDKSTSQKIAEQTKVHFNTSEKFFDNEHDVINWIIDNQLSRRNITDDQRAYLIGKRYKEEKKEHGTTSFSIKEKVKANSLPLPYEKSTAKIIAEQSNVSHQTVKNAEKFADAVDKVAENTGINPQKILSGQISATRKDIQDVSKLEPEIQKKVFEK